MNTHNKKIANQYDLIYKSFDTSRVRIWNNVKLFLSNYNENDTLLDCGCGNGKNMIYANNLGYNCDGYDISKKLLDICISKNLNVYYSDVLNMNLDKKYDKIISIAVLHHLETFDEQVLAINNLLKCLKDNGTLLVSFWSKEKKFNDTNIDKNQNDYRNFNNGANYVDWKLDKNNVIKRYYYIHDYDSILKLVKQINVKYIITWELQNWFIIFYK
jgi:2-polyprenyl-3-methyl-5-hydroxy-6-metoxy-1,4-benzoquinol methylase